MGTPTKWQPLIDPIDMLRQILLPCLALATAHLAGCGTAQLKLTTPIASNATRTEAKLVPEIGNRTAIYIISIEDKRPESMRSYLGEVGGRKVTCDDTASWLEAEILKAESDSICFRPRTSSESTTSRWQASVQILQLYTSAIDVTKSANIVIQVDLISPTGQIQTKVFRGRTTGANWISGEGEIEASLRKAMQLCLQKLVPEVKEMIKNGT